MLVLHQPLHRQRRLWRICGLLGRLQVEFVIINIHPVQSSPRATYATISQRPFGRTTRVCYFSLKHYIWYWVFGWFNKRIHRHQHHIHKYVTLIYIRRVYLFLYMWFIYHCRWELRPSYTARNGRINVKHELGKTKRTAIVFQLHTYPEIWDWQNHVETKPA